MKGGQNAGHSFTFRLGSHFDRGNPLFGTMSSWIFTERRGTTLHFSCQTHFSSNKKIKWIKNQFNSMAGNELAVDLIVLLPVRAKNILKTQLDHAGSQLYSYNNNCAIESILTCDDSFQGFLDMVVYHCLLLGTSWDCVALPEATQACSTCRRHSGQLKSQPLALQPGA